MWEINMWWTCATTEEYALNFQEEYIGGTSGALKYLSTVFMQFLAAGGALWMLYYFFTPCVIPGISVLHPDMKRLSQDQAQLRKMKVFNTPDFMGTSKEKWVYFFLKKIIQQNFSNISFFLFGCAFDLFCFANFWNQELTQNNHNVRADYSPRLHCWEAELKQHHANSQAAIAESSAFLANLQASAYEQALAEYTAMTAPSDE